MSLTSTLLLGEKIELPKGKRHQHYLSDAKPASARLKFASRTAEKAANIERVFEAIVSGAETREKVVEKTGISHATVWKATNSLIDWPGGPRIEMRRKEGRTQFFYAV